MTVDFQFYAVKEQSQKKEENTNKCWWCKKPIPNTKRLCGSYDCRWEYTHHYV